MKSRLCAADLHQCNTGPLKLDGLQDFIACCKPESRHQRKESERFKFYPYADLRQALLTSR